MEKLEDVLQVKRHSEDVQVFEQLEAFFQYYEGGLRPRNHCPDSTCHSRCRYTGIKGCWLSR